LAQLGNKVRVKTRKTDEARLVTLPAYVVAALRSYRATELSSSSVAIYSLLVRKTPVCRNLAASISARYRVARVELLKGNV
jgi:hypothetical protein